MGLAVAEELRVLHTVPGRVRFHLPGWSGKDKRPLETKLRQVEGIRSVQANTVTGNILIQFDPTTTSEQDLLTIADRLIKEASSAAESKRVEKETEPPPATREQRGKMVRSRIAVRGLDRNPYLAKHVVETLEQYTGVRASANLLTGRVLVEFTEHEVELEDLLAEISGLELPELPDESRPADPLDPGPIIQSVVRLAGTTLGLSLITTRRLLHIQEPLPGAATASNIASTISILQGIPAFRYGLRKLFGSTAASLLTSIPSFITLTLAGRQTGLVVNATEALRLLTATTAEQSAWRRYEARIEDTPSAQSDMVIHLESGERTPQTAKVQEGTGTAIGRDGMPQPVSPGLMVPAGARLYGGPFELHLQVEESFQAFIPTPRPSPPTLSIFDRYLAAMGPISLIYALATGLLTRSAGKALTALLLMTPRTAMIGEEDADLSATARVIRAGATVVGTRTDRDYRRPDAVFLDGVRLLGEGFEIHSALSLTGDFETADILALAASLASAAGSPWGGAFRAASSALATNGSFDGKVASGEIEQVRYSLGPVDDWSALPEAARLRQDGDYVLVLRSEREERPLGIFGIRPRLVSGVSELVETCKRFGVELGVIAGGDQLAVQALARRANIPHIDNDNAVETIRAKQQTGAIVAYVSDNAGAAAGFAMCDLAIGLTGDYSRLPVRSDLLAPDLTTVAAIIETCQRRDATVRDSVGLAVVSNIIGLVWGFRGNPTFAHASRPISITSLIAIADGWLRQMGGERQGASIGHLANPHPERWGRRSIEDTLRLLNSSEEGLTNAEAARRLHVEVERPQRNKLLSAFLEQLNSPLTVVYAGGAVLSLLTGAIGDFVIIGATLLANVAFGVWQEQKADQVAEALERIGTATANVLREGQSITIPANEVVLGDILLLAAGDHIAADARVLWAHGLEVDEASLTGESVPVPKMASGGTDASRVVLEGSDVTTGTGRAIVVAVGAQTRMGATAAALSVDVMEQSPLGVRLNNMLRVLLPLSLAGGGIVIGSGLLQRRPVASLLALGVTMFLAAFPEGLPLLASVGEAGVARRLASRDAAVRRLSSVEALGRVDVACTDKTGTLTEGKLALSLVADESEEAKMPAETLHPQLRRVLLAAALASPHPDAPGAKAHPTDVAIVQGAMAAGLGKELYAEHEHELSFDPVRSFHATVAQGHLYVKGAPEALLPRCSWALEHGERRPLDEQGRQKWADRARSFAGQGLRVLMVVVGSPDMSLNNPQELTALGFVGISDPLRPNVQAAVQRCREAGVRVIMITGDHPATARAIAREAGLLEADGEVLTGSEILGLPNGELDEHLEHTTVIARATPLDKLRIIEGLQRHGHTIAMTGDGVNDAPALRLADVGVAMGLSGTEVARQVADVVLADDDFSTLVEALVEGRSYWRNIRRALSLLLGGNLGELGLIVGASLLGNFPLTARQILAMNVVTDLLPALAVTLQEPEHHSLAGLNREGEAALGKPLRNDIFRRAVTCAAPSLASYLITLASGTLPQARAVAYTTIIGAQLAQTLDAGRAEGRLTSSVFAAVGCSGAMLAATLAVPPLRNFLNLAIPGPLGWTLVGAGSLLAVLLNRLLTVPTPALPTNIIPQNVAT